jgi:hypothetical protein
LIDAHLFQNIFNGYNAALLAGVNAVIVAGLAAMAAILQILGVMFVAVFGYLMLTGNMTPKTGMSMVCRILLVQAAMTPLYFNQYVRDVMLDWLPNWIAGAVGTGTGPDAGAAQFDQLRVDIWNLSEHIHLRATGLSNIAERLEIMLLQVFCELVVAASFFMWVFVRALMALVVSIGPFVIVTYLFKATRSFAEHWLGKLGGVAILLLLISVLLKIITVQFGVVIAHVDPNNDNVDTAIEGMVDVLLSMFFGVGLLMYTPRLAFAIGSGAGFDGAGGFAAAASVIGTAARAGKAAFNGAKAGAKAGYRGAKATAAVVQSKFGSGSKEPGE